MLRMPAVCALAWLCAGSQSRPVVQALECTTFRFLHLEVSVGWGGWKAQDLCHANAEAPDWIHSSCCQARLHH